MAKGVLLLKERIQTLQSYTSHFKFLNSLFTLQRTFTLNLYAKAKKTAIKQEILSRKKNDIHT